MDIDWDWEAPPRPELVDPAHIRPPYSAGEVTNPEAYNYRTFLPEDGGLYCQTIFGSVDWAVKSLAFARDPRNTHWGHIALCVPLNRDGPIHAVPVVPCSLRRFGPENVGNPMVIDYANGWAEPTLNQRYRDLVNMNRRVRRLAGLHTPTETLLEHIEGFQTHLDALLEQLQAHPLPAPYGHAFAQRLRFQPTGL